MFTRALFAFFLCTALPAAEPASFGAALVGGKPELNVRARYEGVRQTGLLDAAALTLRTRVGYTTAAFRGWQVAVEGENILAADGDAYSQAGLNSAAGRRAVVADSETTELNQAWLAFTAANTTATAGRQRLVLEQARFVGDVGWRQNQQTFDALVVRDRSFAGTTLTYAYLDRVHRVFSRRHPQGRWDSDSHAMHAARTLPGGLALAAYALLLDFRNAPANSCATYGASVAGNRPLGPDLKLTGRAEFAVQSDHAAAPVSYRNEYVALEAGLAFRRAALGLAHERLGADRGVGFRTPLATLHAWNGWADLFLATPAAGLRDTSLRATADLPAQLALAARHHWFKADAGRLRYGRELDLMLARKFGPHLAVAAKAADFRRASPAWPDVRKFWLQVEVLR